MTATPIAFKPGQSDGLCGGMLVASVITIRQGDVLTPCQPVGVRRFAVARGKAKKCGRTWGRSAPGWAILNYAVHQPEPVLNTTEEDDEWARRSRNTLQGWMADNEE